MNVISITARLCGAGVTAAIFLAGLAALPARAADDLPIIGDISMPQIHLPQVHVDVRVGDDDLRPPPRPRLVDPRGPFVAIPPARFKPPVEGTLVPPFDLVPPFEVARMLRSTGYSLLGRIDRRGWVYTVAVLTPRGDDGRAIIDARTGAIIRFVPALAVNPRLNDELGVIYGPPGPPRVVQDFRIQPRPSKPVQRVTKREGAPKIADRMPVSSPPVPSKPADARAEMRSAPALTLEAKPAPEAKPAQETKLASPELLPTQPMPDVQTLD